MTASSSASTALGRSRRRQLLMDTSLDPAQKIVSVRSHAPDFHPTTVGGADPESLQPLFQPSLEGYYPYMGYETATPQCKRVLNRYFGKCMFGSGSGGGGHRFRQVGLRENIEKHSGDAPHAGSGIGALRGADTAFRDSMDFAEAIAGGDVVDPR